MHILCICSIGTKINAYTYVCLIEYPQEMSCFPTGILGNRSFFSIQELDYSSPLLCSLNFDFDVLLKNNKSYLAEGDTKELN